MTRKKLLFAYNFLLFLIACTIVLITTVQVSYGQTTETYSAAGSYTFTVPAGVTSITVKAWGGGGGGGYSNSGNGNKSAAGGGGGGGGYRTGTFNVIGGQTITIEVGVGGNGASADGQGGSPGGNSTVTYSGISIIANGGGGGGRGIDKNNGGPGGAGGSGSGGTGGYTGAAGATGSVTVGGSGGGGAGDGANANGVTGGTNSGGAGGAGGTSGNSGSNGRTIGGGGGGTGDDANPPDVGGNGAGGQVRIAYTCSTYSITGIAGTEACASIGTSIITVNSTAANLPVGTYTVTYSRDNPSATGLKATMQVTTAGSGTFTANGLTSAGNCTITITNIGSGSSNGTNILCNSAINSNNTASINVTSAVLTQPSVITGNTTLCEGSTQTYSVTNVAGVQYDWVLPAGWMQTGGGNSNSITVTVGSGSGNIQVTPFNACGNGTARTLAVNVTSITILGFPGSRCGAGTGVITLSGWASAGTIKWYNSYGDYLSTGTSFTTPVLNTTTTYFAEATNGSCTSARIPVTAYVITPPSLSAGGGGTYCYGTNVNLSCTVSGADNVYWEGPNGYYSVQEDPILTGVTPSMSGAYTVNSNALSGINLITNGDFEMGNTGFNSAYTNSTNLVPEGTYAVVANPNTVHTAFANCANHSTSGTLQMVINGAVAPGVTVWSQTVNVVPNTYYQFTYWVQSVVGNNPSALQLYINGVSAGPVYTAITSTCNWGEFLYNWESGSNTSALLELKNQNIVAGGNDFSLDDIVFQHTCTSSASVNVTVNTDVTAGSIGTIQTICRGNVPAALTSVTAGTGSGTISYEWETNASGSYVTIPGATGATYSPPALDATTSYRRRTVSHSGGATCYSGYTNVVTITVNGPSANAGGPNDICQSASPSPLTLTGASYGGGAISAAWSIVSGGGTLSTTAHTTSPQTVTYTPQANYNGTVILRLTTSLSPCSATSDRKITVVPSASAVAGNAITTCSNSGAVNITAGAVAFNYSSVAWTSNGTGTFANANSLTDAAYTPSATDIAAGSIILTLTATGNSPCGNAVSTKTLTITTLPAATISYTGLPFCKSVSTAQDVVRTGSAGGTYSASPSGLSINTATGAITPSTSSAGTYTVAYTMAATGGCVAQTATTTVTITNPPVATFSYAGSPYCKNTANPSPTFTGGGIAGTFSSTAGLVFVSTATGQINLAASTPGTYTVTNTIAATGGCAIQAAIATVTITNPPVPTFNYAGSPYCKNAANPSPTFTGGGVAGTFSSTAGLVFVSAATGQINLAVSTPGTYTVTNTIAATGGCTVQTAAATVTISAVPAATISYAGTPFCKSVATAQAVTRTGTAGGNYTASPSGLSINAVTGAITPSTSSAGTYTVTYTMGAAGGCSAQTATATVTITALPSATFSYTGSPYCSNQANPLPTFHGGGEAGIFTSTAGLVFENSSTGQVNLAASAAGTYTVTNTIAASGGCGMVSATSTITILPDGSWTGAINQDWNNPGNWACNQLPTIATNVFIGKDKPRYPILSTGDTGKAHDITMESNTSATVASNTLQIAGSIFSSGTFTATEGTIEMKGSAPQTIAANVFATNTLMSLIINNASGVTLQGPLNITAVVNPLIGTFNANGYLTLLSTATQTALIDGSGSGNVVGNVSMQRYLSSAFGYKYFSSPFRSATVAAFKEEVNLNEDFSTFYSYDENHSIDTSGVTVYRSGWTKYTQMEYELVPLYGYAANLGINKTPTTVQVSGEVNNGPLSLTLYNHNRKYTTGYNLVGNPYPSPIDWDATGWTKNNIDGAIYFFNAGNTNRYTGVYTSYVDGKSTGGGDNIIAAMQGFFVHVTDGTYPVTGTLGVTNSVRVNNLNPIFKSASIDSRPTLRLTAGFEGQNALKDVALVYFDPVASAGFEKGKDALKIENTDEHVPNIYTIAADHHKLSINGLMEPADSLSNIAVGITTLQDGTLSLRAENVKDFPFMQLYLVDGLTGIYHDLRQSPEVRFTLQRGIYDSRFKLVFSKSLSMGQNGQWEKLFSLMRTGDQIVVKVNLPFGTKGTLLVTNVLGQTILHKEVSEKQTVGIRQDISTGVYVVTLVSGRRTESEKILMRQDYE